MYIAEGLADDRIAIIHKVHHVLADGMASANQMAMAMQPDRADRSLGTFEEPDIERTPVPPCRRPRRGTTSGSSASGPGW